MNEGRLWIVDEGFLGNHVHGVDLKYAFQLTLDSYLKTVMGGEAVIP